ncbi:hypothetical protein RhiJN_23364 [Ceratobasidium sp. AG-Ba]|nr:hypothetical protein RhiJN_23364 [Ceratobasidium sp. AG-Ba]
MSNKRRKTTRSKASSSKGGGLGKTPAPIDDIMFDSEDEAYLPGVSQLVASIRAASPSPMPDIVGFNSLIMRLGERVNALDTGAYAQEYSDPYDGWSRYAVELLKCILVPVSERNPDLKFARAPEALSRFRHALIQAVNVVDKFADQVEASIRRPCPDSCKPPLPKPKSTAEKGVITTPTLEAMRPQRPPNMTAPPSNTQPARTPARSYAQAATSAAPPANIPKPPASAGLPAKPKTAPLPVAEPVRLVIRFGGNPPPALRNGPQTEIFRKISMAFDIHPTIKGISILGAHWNKNNNIIVSFPHGTPESTALSLRPAIRAALGIPESVDITIDKPWSKLMVSSVPARAAPGAPVFSEADLAASFVRNPAVQNIAITRQPRWIRNPSNIAGAHSSFVFSFEDPDGSVSRILRKTPLFVFGAPVSVKPWQVRPRTNKTRRALGIPSGVPVPDSDGDAHMSA